MDRGHFAKYPRKWFGGKDKRVTWSGVTSPWEAPSTYSWPNSEFATPPLLYLDIACPGLYLSKVLCVTTMCTTLLELVYPTTGKMSWVQNDHRWNPGLCSHSVPLIYPKCWRGSCQHKAQFSYVRAMTDLRLGIRVWSWNLLETVQ